MVTVHTLPSYLVQRYHGWHATSYQADQAWFRRLAEQGQHPRAMLVSCSDSRIHLNSIFGADEGEFFIHRNIAGLIPPYETAGAQHGTSAAIEFGVKDLGVAHLLIVAHKGCGGVNGCLNMWGERAHEDKGEFSFVSRWMEILRPGYERVADLPEEEIHRALEEQAVLISLENLMTFPFVRDEVERGVLTLHGLRIDTGEGILTQYDPETKQFVPV